jgi:hypothetical protein
LANALTTKWQMTERTAFKMSSLEEAVAERTREQEQSREMFNLMAESTNAVRFTLDITHSCFSYIGALGVAASGVPEAEWMQPGGLDIVIPRATNPEVKQRFDECANGLFEFVTALSQRNDARTEVRWTFGLLAAALHEECLQLIDPTKGWRRAAALL